MYSDISGYQYCFADVGSNFGNGPRCKGGGSTGGGWGTVNRTANSFEIAAWIVGSYSPNQSMIEEIVVNGMLEYSTVIPQFMKDVLVPLAGDGAGIGRNLTTGVDITLKIAQYLVASHYINALDVSDEVKDIALVLEAMLIFGPDIVTDLAAKSLGATGVGIGVSIAIYFAKSIVSEGIEYIGRETFAWLGNDAEGMFD